VTRSSPAVSWSSNVSRLALANALRGALSKTRIGGAELDDVVLLRLDEDLEDGAVVRSVLGGDVAEDRNLVEETRRGRARERSDGGVAADRVLRHWEVSGTSGG